MSYRLENIVPIHGDDFYLDQIEAYAEQNSRAKREVSQWQPSWSIRRRINKIARVKRKALKTGHTFKEELTFDLRVAIQSRGGWVSSRILISEEETQPIKEGLVACAAQKDLEVSKIRICWNSMTMGPSNYETWRVVATLS